MFNHPFSFSGRIRRTEYGLSSIFVIILVYGLLFLLGTYSYNNPGSADGIVVMYYVVMFFVNWFCYAQGAKRCHDLGNSGWMQLIPFYFLWMLFQDGQMGTNQYGPNPKTANHGYTRDSPQNYAQTPPPVSRYVETPTPSAPQYARESSPVSNNAPERPSAASDRKTQMMDAKTIMGTFSCPGKLVDIYGQTYQLHEGINTIGRADSSSTASVQIGTNDRYMSRNHAVILVDTNRREINNILRFGNNTQISIYHNGVPLSPGENAKLSNGDIIRLGHTELTFRL